MERDKLERRERRRGKEREKEREEDGRRRERRGRRRKRKKRRRSKLIPYLMSGTVMELSAILVARITYTTIEFDS